MTGDRRRASVARLSWLASLAVVVAACGAGEQPAAEPPPAPQDEIVEPDEPTPDPTPPAREADPTPAPPEEDPPVPEALDFTAPAVEGGQVVGAEYAGQAVAFWFWAPW